jgi:hypothetical protein
MPVGWRVSRIRENATSAMERGSGVGVMEFLAQMR